MPINEHAMITKAGDVFRPARNVDVLFKIVGDFPINFLLDWIKS